MGIRWGFFMFVIMAILMPLVMKEEITQNSILVGIGVCLLGGLIYGFGMKIYLCKKCRNHCNR